MTPIVVVAVLVPVVLPLIWMVVLYNRFTSVHYHLKTSWSDVDVELKRRYDLIPNLVEVVEGYAKHERSTLEALIELRAVAVANDQRPDLQSDDELALEKGLGEVMLVVEAYPDLKANQNFMELQKELSETETRIARARRFYNANVRSFRTAVMTFPKNVIAGMFGFQSSEFSFFEASAGDREAVKVDATDFS